MQTDGSSIYIEDKEKTINCYFLYHDTKKLLTAINRETQKTKIYPFNTRIGSSSFLQPKYRANFMFEGYDIDVETRGSNEINEELHLISGLPKVFIQTLKYGLGLIKEYRFIAGLAENVDGCEFIICSKIKETGFEGKNIIISDSDLDKIRRGLDRTSKFYNNEALQSKELFIHNEILHHIDETRFPERKISPKKDIICSIVKNLDFTKSISVSDKKSLIKIKDRIDLDCFSALKIEFDKKIGEDKGESVFQKFFERNPLLLTLFIGSPYMLFQNQAFLGGKSFNNKNGQYTDFLYQHKLTNNSFIIEIKRPNTPLLDRKKCYREGVFAPSNDLTGTVSQVLAQKHQLETNIASLSINSDDKNIETYNVQCLIIIGLLSTLAGENSKANKRSFELFRNNQKNIRIMTYDECQEHLNLFLDNVNRSNP